jgi:hypothetical protein
MGSPRVLKWIVVAMVVMGDAGGCSSVYADTIYTYGGPFSLRIPADPDNTMGWMDDAIINVPDHITIADIDVRINITHTNVFDLQLYLVDSTNTTVLLNMYNVDEFFIGANYTDTIFDDEADTPIEQGQPPFTGRFRPREPEHLARFDGHDAFGIWRLRIYDFWLNDAGSLDSFEIIITTPEPGTATLLILGVGLLRLCNPRRMPNRLREAHQKQKSPSTSG